MLVAALVVGAAAAVLAAAPQPQFGTGVQVVEVFASVTDAADAPIQGLDRDQFTVYENGQPQTISTFIEADFPLSVAIAIDRSWSMAGDRLATARHGARALLEGLRPEDQAMIVAISGEVEVIAPLSLDRDTQREALLGLDPWSTTALHDAIVAAIDRVQAGTGRRTLVLLSDGDDRYSRTSRQAVLEHARRADVMVYPAALGRGRSELFAELAVLTGGRSFHARNREALDTAMRDVARELRTQYLLGYTPARSGQRSGEWRSIRVEVARAGARVRARDGYFDD